MTSPFKLVLLATAAVLASAVPASAQHAGHSSAPAQPQASCPPEHAAMGHCTPAPAQKAAPKPTPAPPAQATCTPEHAAMGHCTLAPAPSVAPTPVCLPEHAAMGHCTLPATGQGGQAVDPHAGHAMPGTPGPTAVEGTDLPAGNSRAPAAPVANAADAIYGTAAMDMGRHHLNHFHGGQKLFQLMNSILEYRAGRGPGGFAWESEGWYGGDIHRLWLKGEGEGAFGEGVESAEVQALFSRAIDPYWNVQGGLRYDFKPDPSRVYATVQLEGLAPSFFHVEGALFVSNKGELMARVGGSYDQRITQRLILQPGVEFDLAAQNSRDIGVGAGLSEAEIGVRLRYDIRREFSPYVGVQYERAYGRTAKYLRDEGEKVGGLQLLVGVRTWF